MFLNHIEEHKWYLNEREGGSVTLAEATQSWFETIYAPLCRLFRAEGVLECFPGKTAAELYIEIMTNKYFLSTQAGSDVGMLPAMYDYAERFGALKGTQSLMKKITDTMKSLLGFSSVRRD
jgi:hypothetical protein